MVAKEMFRVITSHIPIEGLKRIGGENFIITANLISVTQYINECVRQRLNAYIKSKGTSSGFFDMTWDSGCFAGECSLTFDFDDLHIKVNWSSAQRTALQAASAVFMYDLIVKYAVKIQAVMDELKNSREYQKSEAE